MEKTIKLDENTYILDMEEIHVITFKLDEDFLKTIDDLVKRLGYNNRSDLIRDAIMSYIDYLKENERSL
ncbi:ribbon-helix-helix domain-containing protein [Sulfurisphaera tokodaii]|uniref:Ribbon-helix-helix protein CopG domain-containing protein n=2 Tax=Sulfurisphaera tokodaii TaxID=111955 RepID=Q96XK3_SULTO|nr:ribbon-helix-helix domain-containing protein [Sulfurisphaera tokodaii]BAB67624.1 hypothetical protein STK_25115 [Sulfurisphaera tokodaii str. 7]HII75308.1 ribbon-helix-helix protein, CopG family [Sulfurisphaera tokodaii]